MRRQFLILAGFLAAFGAVTEAQAVACMVMGEPTAKVRSADGEKSPAFLSNACESLRLVSGKAVVSWIARDGKPHFAPIGANGADGLPSAGAEERSASVVWAELTSKREAERPAFMRALAEERPARVYIPAQGLTILPKAGADLRLLEVSDAGERLVLEQKSVAQSAVHLGREQLKPGALYVLEWKQGGTVENWRWKMLDEAETRRIDSEYDRIQADLADASQRRIMVAMLYQQMKLRVNMLLALAAEP